MGELLILLAVAAVALFLILRSKKTPPKEYEPTPGNEYISFQANPTSQPSRLFRPRPDEPLRVIKFSSNTPEGNWVNWKIGSGWFEVAGVKHREREVLEFLSAAENASDKGQHFGVKLMPDSNNRYDKNAIKVIGTVGSKEYFIGFVPKKVAEAVTSWPADMPKAAELKQAKVGHSMLIVSVAGLTPPAKVRRQEGWEKEEPKPPVEDTSSTFDTEALAKLIDHMNATKPLSKKQVATLIKKRQDALFEEIETKGSGNIQHEEPLSHLRLPEEEYKAFMKKADNDLAQQVSIVRDSFDFWLKSGMTPAPYYAYRIAVILSKAKRKDLEKEFLAAWTRHFPTGNGKRYADLAERARKMGIEVPAG